VFGAAAALLILDAGPIQEKDSYGAATVFGGTFAGGVDLGVSGRGSSADSTQDRRAWQ
jgi:hypothetical protein